MFVDDDAIIAKRKQFDYFLKFLLVNFLFRNSSRAYCVERLNERECVCAFLRVIGRGKWEGLSAREESSQCFFIPSFWNSLHFILTVHSFYYHDP